MSKILGIILLKSKSRRIKKKNFVKLNNKMMFQHVLEESIRSGKFSKIHLSTEDKKIALMLSKLKEKKLYNKIDISFLRPPHMAEDKYGMLDVLKYAVLKFKKKGEIYSGVCMIYATACLLKKNDIVKFVDCFKGLQKNKNVSLQTIVKYPAPIEWAVSVNKSKLLNKINKKAHKKTSDSFEYKYYDSGGLHAFTEYSLMKSKNCKAYGYKLPYFKSIDIDYPEDLAMVKKLM